MLLPLAVHLALRCLILSHIDQPELPASILEMASRCNIHIPFVIAPDNYTVVFASIGSRCALTMMCTLDAYIACQHCSHFRLQAWEAEVVGPPSMTLREYYKLMLLDYGFGRAEVNQVVDAADSDDYHAIVDRLHARHGLFVEGPRADGGGRTASGHGGGLPDGRAADGTHGVEHRQLREEEEEEAAIEEEASEETPETTPSSSMAQTPI